MISVSNLGAKTQINVNLLHTTQGIKVMSHEMHGKLFESPIFTTLILNLELTWSVNLKGPTRASVLDISTTDSRFLNINLLLNLVRDRTMMLFVKIDS